MNLEDGLVVYESWDSKFWKFTSELEKKAEEMLKLLVEERYEPSDSDKAKAHKLLDEIESWKAGCDKKVKGNRAILNSPLDVWNAFRDAMKADKNIDAIRSIMTLHGFGKTTRMSKRASAVLRMFKPNDWGVVDWRAAAMLKHLELNNWNVDDALRKPPIDEEPWRTYVDINDWLAVDLNQVYRNKRIPPLQRTADVEMAVFALSLEIKRWNIT